MEQKIQMQHPLGKKAIKMDKFSYEIVSQAILGHLMLVGRSTHSQILQAITEEFNGSNIKFKGSLEWYMEWVKLDLEAKQIIKRCKDKTLVTYTIA